jgi:hypothetical protein
VTELFQQFSHLGREVTRVNSFLLSVLAPPDLVDSELTFLQITR